jgi:hypothetical protein
MGGGGGKWARARVSESKRWERHGGGRREGGRGEERQCLWFRV